jgi:hypothetical protein
MAALEAQHIDCAEIGALDEGPPVVWRAEQAGRVEQPRPARDEIARVFEAG